MIFSPSFQVHFLKFIYHSSKEKTYSLSCRCEIPTIFIYICFPIQFPQIEVYKEVMEYLFGEVTKRPYLRLYSKRTFKKA